MYWQIYFHPVTRSSEIILRQIFKRAKTLVKQGFNFRFMLDPLPQLFEGELAVHEYLQLDEALIQTAFMQWRKEDDAVLSELCERFMDRRLYKYVEVEQIDVETIEEMREAFAKAGLNPEYDLEIDFPTDLPYDVFRPNESTDKQILLLDRQDQLHELSEVSDIVRSISGIHRGKHHLYYPQNKVDTILHELPSHLRPYFS